MKKHLTALLAISLLLSLRLNHYIWHKVSTDMEQIPTLKVLLNNALVTNDPLLPEWLNTRKYSYWVSENRKAIEAEIDQYKKQIY